LNRQDRRQFLGAAAMGIMAANTAGLLLLRLGATGTIFLREASRIPLAEPIDLRGTGARLFAHRAGAVENRLGLLLVNSG
jgi:hypothetical protein